MGSARCGTAADPIPCDGDIGTGGNLLLLDHGGDGWVDVTDIVQNLSYLFLGEAAHHLGTTCQPIPDCPPGLRGLSIPNFSQAF